MDKDEKWSGVWWIPGQKKNLLTGRLYYKNGISIKLEIQGEFNKSGIFENRYEHHKILLGRDNKNNKFTLVNCTLVDRFGAYDYEDPFNRSLTTEYSIRYILIGHHFEEFENLIFNKTICRFSKLNSWFIGKYSDVISQRKNNQVIFSINEELESNAEIPSVGNLRLFAHTNYTNNYSDDRLIAIRKSVYCEIKPIDPQIINELKKQIEIFSNFLMLVSCSSSKPLEIFLENDKLLDSASNYPVSIQLYFTDGTILNQQRRNEEFIISHSDISFGFPEVLKKWFEEFPKFKNPYTILFDQFRFNKKVDSNTFLNLMQSIESYHHFKYPNSTELPKDEYKAKLDGIFDQLSENDIPWLKNKLSFANKITLQARLEHILDLIDSKEIDEFIGNHKTFVNQLRDSRNYYTHLTKKRKHVKEGIKLQFLTIKLRMVYIYWILKGLIQNKELLEKRIQEFIYHNFHQIPNGEIE